MAAASNYLENMTVNALLRGGTFTAPANIYVALHTASPGESSGANEVTTVAWPSYVRLDSAAGGALSDAWSDPSLDDGVSKNQIQLLYPLYNGLSNMNITHFSLWDAATGGNYLIGAALSTVRTIQPSDVLVIDIEKLTVRVL